ncbi:MAG: TlpA family protein disulfide reductase [Candidatus Liptonbacteria bacterium]|nr:TlpA family protein disulfide reductase [Candidatus Liptonbacteria bacterium]
MNKVLALIIGILIVGGIGWLVISNRTIPDASNRQAQFGKAPDFALQDYNDNTVKLADFAGKPLIINSWAAWCPFCKKELSDFVAAQKEFGDKVVIIAIDRSESLAIAKGYTDQQGITDDLIFLLDPSDSFYQSIGGFSMPETIFVDANGNVVFHKRGPMPIEEIRQKIMQIISP